MPSPLPSAVLLASALATGVGAPAPQTPIERLDALMADYAGDLPVAHDEDRGTGDVSGVIGHQRVEPFDGGLRRGRADARGQG